MVKEIPYFIEVRGCINCGASKVYKEKHGKDYGFDHETQVLCILNGCVNFNHSLYEPFYDAEEIVRIAKKDGREETIDGAKQFLENINKKFGDYYNQIGISIKDLINKL